MASTGVTALSRGITDAECPITGPTVVRGMIPAECPFVGPTVVPGMIPTGVNGLDYDLEKSTSNPGRTSAPRVRAPECVVPAVPEENESCGVRNRGNDLFGDRGTEENDSCGVRNRGKRLGGCGTEENDLVGGRGTEEKRLVWCSNRGKRLVW